MNTCFVLSEDHNDNILQDINIQNAFNNMETIPILEKIIRFYILAMHHMCEVSSVMAIPV